MHGLTNLKIPFTCLDVNSFNQKNCTEEKCSIQSLLGVETPKDPTCHVSGTGQTTGRLFLAVQSVATVQPAAVVVELTWLKTMWMLLFQKTVSSPA